MGAFKLFQQSYLSSMLTPLSVRELLFIEQAPCEIWFFEQELFDVLFIPDQYIDRQTIKDLISKGIFQVFIDYKDIPMFQTTQQENLRRVTRGLSVGNTEENSKKQMQLLSINMGYLFKDPVNDDALDLQFQSSKNLLNFMLDRNKNLPDYFKNYYSQKHHFTISQPLLSSMLLAAFLRYTKHFSPREVEMLFLTSYFKDIGMSLIPSDTYDKKELSDQERRLMNDHAQHSLSILKGRVPLNPNYLGIIGNHHGHSLLGEFEHDEDEEDHMIDGVETLFISMIDSFVAMISPRPYREGMKVYQALEVIKNLYAKDHPREFKYLVQFIQKFFAKVFNK